jgi:hypothetical protein
VKQTGQLEEEEEEPEEEEYSTIIRIDSESVMYCGGTGPSR